MDINDQITTDKKISTAAEQTYREFPNECKDSGMQYGRDINVFRKRKAFHKGAMYVLENHREFNLEYMTTGFKDALAMAAESEIKKLELVLAIKEALKFMEEKRGNHPGFGAPITILKTALEKK